MRQPARLEPKGTLAQRAGVGILRSVPPPVGGWNARDPLAQMKPLDAVRLDNWFPRVADVVIRGGCTDHLTGLGVQGYTLAVYNAPAGSQKMFVSTDANIFDASSAGAVGAGLSACTSGKWQQVQMGVTAGHYLILANGVDKMKMYDGAAWIVVDAASSPAITGVTTSNIIGLTVYNRRLFMLEKNKLNFWYLPADAVGGAALEFTLGSVTTRGGYTMAAAAWSFDGGNGPDDYLAFATSEGEVIIYRGTNPSDATLWSRVGTYFVGKPIGRRCFTKYGGDLILVTQNGAFPMSKALQSASVDYKMALSNKIENAFTDASRSYFANFGWEGTLYPAQNAFIFNVPTQQDVASEQYVMNTITKSWCKFTGWAANCFAEFNKELYFATNGKVVKAWTGKADYGTDITAYAQTAYNYFGEKTLKRWILERPLLMVDGPLTYSLGLSVDFQQLSTLGSVSFNITAGGIWDVSLWDVGTWAGSLETRLDWSTTPQKDGACAAMLLRISTHTVEVQWASNDYFFERLTGILS